MRRTTWMSLLVVAVAGAGLYAVVVRPFNTELSVVRGLSSAFLEDLQFKDFRSSALYHHALDLDRIDIGRALEELFLVKPEFLDVLDFRVSRAEIDSSGKRARVVMTARFRILNKEKEPREADIVLYWIKRHPDCPLGADCSPDGQCLDEFGRPALRPAGGIDEEKERRTRDPRKDAVKEKEAGEPYSCDPSLEPRWYMNLDSTLKQKDYR